MTKLYIFVTSERPDQYLNPILHCLEQKNVTEIIFVHIDKLNESSIQNSIAKKLRNDVQFFLNCLAIDGDYRYFVPDENHKEGDRVHLQDIYKENAPVVINLYRKLLDKDPKWSYLDILYANLRKVLSNIHNKEPDSIFDISAIDKSFLGDIFAISTVENIKEIYTFALKERPNFVQPWKTLFYELRAERPENRKYEYTNVVDTHVFKECADSIFVRKFPLKIILLISLLLIAALSFANIFFGAGNLLNQAFAIVSIVASIVAIPLSIFPLKKF